MRRRTLDTLLASGGIVVSVVLVIAGSLLLWAHSFVSGQVKTQLAEQRITFPAAGSASLADPAVKPYLTRYAGQQMTNGAQAQAYANHFIAVHLEAIGGGKTYSELSAEAKANPTDTKLASTVETMFKGETLRGLLLNAYAFGTMATIAAYAATVSFIGAALMLVLSALGFLHSRRTDPEEDVLSRHEALTPTSA